MTQARADVICTAIAQYVEEKGDSNVTPATIIPALVANDYISSTRYFMDAWGREFLISRLSPALIYSRGENGIDEGALGDDVSCKSRADTDD